MVRQIKTTSGRRCALLLGLLVCLLIPSAASAATCQGVWVGPATTVVSDATRDALGLRYWPDTGFGVLREADGRLRFLAHNGDGGTSYPPGQVVTTRGTLDDPLQAGVVSRASIAGAPPGYTYVGGGPVYRDPASGTVLQTLHLEQAFASGRFYATLHLGLFDPATGRTQYLGPIVSPDVDFATAAALDWNADIGTSSLTVSGGYLYVYFPDYQLNPDNVSVTATPLSVARARLSDVLSAARAGRVVAWSKYHDGGWGSPALGGPSTAVRPGHSAWHPSVVRRADGSVVMSAGISLHELVLASSPDGVTGWTDEVPLVRDASRAFLYSTLVPLAGDPASDGRAFYLYSVQSDSWPFDVWADASVQRRLIRCTSGATPQRVPLIRYLGGFRHRATTAPMTDPGMAPERGGMWYLLDAQAPGTRPVYGCRSAAGWQFVSIDPGCGGEQNVLVQSEGWISTSPTATASTALYSCWVPSSGDHFVSSEANCEGVAARGLLGYAQSTSKVVLSRFFDGRERWDTTGAASSAYGRERGWLIEGAPAGGTVPLYGCAYAIPGGVNHFISAIPDCEGTTVLRTEGWISTSPPQGTPSTPLYRCYVPASYDHFLAERTDCDGVPGAIREGLMGYAELAEPRQAAFSFAG